MLPSAEFNCLRVAYREAFWEELSRLIWRGRSIRRPLLFSVHVPYVKYFSTAYRRELVAVFKVSCFPFLNYFASFLLDIIFLPALSSRPVYSLLLHLDPREKISLPIQDLFCSRKLLTFPCSASVQCGWTARENWVSVFASTHLLYPKKCKLLDCTVIR